MSYAVKLEAAILWLGPRYVLHPSRRVEKLKEAQQSELLRADVAATFKRVRKAQEAAK